MSEPGIAVSVVDWLLLAVYVCPILLVCILNIVIVVSIMKILFRLILLFDK
jgi:hypothetical protein